MMAMPVDSAGTIVTRGASKTATRCLSASPRAMPTSSMVWCSSISRSPWRRTPSPAGAASDAGPARRNSASTRAVSSSMSKGFVR